MALTRRSTFIALCSLLVITSIAAAESARAFQAHVSGTGRPILLIPGLASSGDTWETTVAHLSDRFTCHVLTLAGFAGTPPVGGPVFATVRRQLAGYIRDQRLDRPIVIGHSLGGMLALGLAADHPDLVGPLVIVDALPFLAGPNLQVKSAEEAQPRAAAMAARMSQMMDEQWTAFANSGVSTRYMVTSPADAATLIEWSASTDRQTLTRALTEAYSVDLREEIDRITSPVLVLATWRGWHDQLAASKIEVPKASFLDIQMPGGSGFDVLERLERIPLVVFTTAFDEYAVRAFEVNALDYLLKPVRPERLAAVLDKARTALTAARDGRQPGRLRAPAGRVFLRDGERCWIVQWSEIVLFEVEGNYTRAYFGGNRPLVRVSLSALEARLDPSLFFRVSRRHIVNLRFIESVETTPDDTYIIHLRNKSEIPVSRRQSRQLRESLGLVRNHSGARSPSGDRGRS